MKKRIFTAVLALSISMMSINAFAAKKSGETIFKEKCASCHPDGGNIVNQKKSLKGLKSAKAIGQKIRKGGGGMPAFDTKSISANEAKLVSDYILKTFK